MILRFRVKREVLKYNDSLYQILVNKLSLNFGSDWYLVTIIPSAVCSKRFMLENAIKTKKKSLGLFLGKVAIPTACSSMVITVI